MKELNLISGVNKTRFLFQYELCECTYGLNKSVCNSNQKWSHDECWCKCKELDEWDFYEKNYLCIPSTCDFKCNEACQSDE